MKIGKTKDWLTQQRMQREEQRTSICQSFSLMVRRWIACNELMFVCDPTAVNDQDKVNTVGIHALADKMMMRMKMLDLVTFLALKASPRNVFRHEELSMSVLKKKEKRFVFDDILFQHCQNVCITLPTVQQIAPCTTFVLLF